MSVYFEELTLLICTELSGGFFQISQSLVDVMSLNTKILLMVPTRTTWVFDFGFKIAQNW